MLLGIPVHTPYRSELSSRSPSGQSTGDTMNFLQLDCLSSSNSRPICPSVLDSQYNSRCFIKTPFSTSLLKCGTLRLSLNPALTKQKHPRHKTNYFLSVTIGPVTLRTIANRHRFERVMAIHSVSDSFSRFLALYKFVCMYVAYVCM